MLLWNFVVRLEYGASKFHEISAKDRFIKFCKFHGWLLEIYRAVLQNLGKIPQPCAI